MQKRKLIALAAVAGMLAMILDSRIALSAAAEGVQLCISTVIPSLFPFLFLSGIFGRSCPGTGLPGQLLGKAYGIPPSMEFMLVPMLLGGYPVGAQCIYEAYRQGTVSKETAQRMLAWCSNCGPAFLFGMLAAFFPSRKLLWLLWGIVLFFSWAASFVFSAPCNARRMDKAASPFGIDTTIGAMRKICGWVILFRVLLGFLNRWFLGTAPAEVRVLCAGLLELSNGSCMLNLIADERIRFCICGVLLAGGGLCVLFQTASVCPGFSMKYYLLGKLVQAATAGITAAGIAFGQPVLIITWVGVLFLLKILEKRLDIFGRFVYNGRINRQEAEYAVPKKD